MDQHASCHATSTGAMQTIDITAALPNFVDSTLTPIACGLTGATYTVSAWIVMRNYKVTKMTSFMAICTYES